MAGKFEFGIEIEFELKIELNLKVFEVFLKKIFGFPLLLDIRGVSVW